MGLDLPSGALVSGEHFGRYQFIRLLGRGGMGAVYECWDPAASQRVAVKVLHAHLASDPAAIRRFRREAELSGSISHPRVVHVRHAEIHADHAALEMDFIDGQPLSAALRAGPIPAPETVRILEQVLDALSACHRAGVVHCDLKPGNLLVNGDGEVFIADFGIARALANMGQHATTVSGPLWSTPAYAAPELWEGGKPSPSWDLYALGVIAYECLSGQLPYRSETPAGLMRDALRGKAPPIRGHAPGVSPQLEQLVARLMHRRPGHRIGSAEEALRLLRGVPEYHAAPMDTAPVVPRRTHRFAPALALAANLLRRPSIRLGLACAAAFVTLGTWFALAPGRFPARPAGVAEAFPSNPQGTIAEGDYVYFSGEAAASGREPWYGYASDPTPHVLKDIVPGEGSSNPHAFLRRPAGGFFFSAATPETGEEIWYGSNLGSGSIVAAQVRDILPGPMSSEPLPLAAYETMALYYATTLEYGAEPWLVSPSGAQTGIVADLFPGRQSSKPTGLAVCPAGEKVYFVAMSDAAHGMRLYQYSFASNAIRTIGDVAETDHSIARVGTRVLIDNASPEHGEELWVLEEESGGFGLLKDIAPGAAASSPAELTEIDGQVYFQAFTPSTGRECWVSDGTAAGTHLVQDINPGAADSGPFRFTKLGSHVLMSARTRELGCELWAVSGGAASLARDLKPGPDSGNPYRFTGNGEMLLFGADDGVHGDVLWLARVDGDSIRVDPVQDAATGAFVLEPDDIAWCDAKSACFSAVSGPQVRTLWRLSIERAGAALQTSVRKLVEAGATTG